MILQRYIMNNILLHKPLSSIAGSIALSGSKSLSNRVLIIKALSGIDVKLNNLSTSDDTKYLQRALELIKKNNDETSCIDVGHAGTDLRFLTALLSISNKEFVLTGSERLQQRPISQLVDALRLLGADIKYENNEGFPPLKIKGQKLIGGKIKIESTTSSQFISALLMIAPCLEKGIELELVGESVSKPYIEMTIACMKMFSADVVWNNNVITVNAGNYKIINREYDIESDWSSASYYYSLVALSPIGTKLFISTLQQDSLQADSMCASIYKYFGVNTHYKNGGIELNKTEHHQTNALHYNFINCPDIAQTVACTCLGLGINFEFEGLKTLVVKETNRIEALKIEFLKFNQTLKTTENSIRFQFNKNHELLKTPLFIDTYNDHRMALAFAPLCLVYNNIQINNADVVSKSYPHYWDDLKNIGLSIK